MQERPETHLSGCQRTVYCFFSAPGGGALGGLPAGPSVPPDGAGGWEGAGGVEKAWEGAEAWRLAGGGMGVVAWAGAEVGPVACGILVPRPGIEPRPPAVEAGVLSTSVLRNRLKRES